MTSLKRLSTLVAIVSLFGLLTFLLVLNASANIDDPRPGTFLFRTYPGLFLALASGLFGATFSMLAQIQRRTAEASLADLSSASAWQTLSVRSSVGVGAAAILYFFFRSGLLEGSLWPDLSQLGYDALVAGGPDALVPNKDLCLLVIWCFIGGFSETLVPTILTRTEQKASTS